MMEIGKSHLKRKISNVGLWDGYYNFSKFIIIDLNIVIPDWELF